LEIVDKYPEALIIREKESTIVVNIIKYEVDIRICKEKSKKLSNYPQPIILFIPFLKRK
jgi:hypothetical protein